MPDNLSAQPGATYRDSTSLKVAPSALLFVIIAFFVILISARMNDLALFLGALTVAATLLSVAVILIGIQYVRMLEGRHARNFFQNIFAQENYSAFLENKEGQLIEINQVGQSLLSKNRDACLQDLLSSHFNDALGLEHRLRSVLSQGGDRRELIEDKNGVRCELGVAQCDGDMLLWTIRPEIVPRSTEHEIEIPEGVAVIKLADNGIICSSNSHARALNFAEGDVFKIPGDRTGQGAIVEFPDAKSRFRVYRFGADGRSKHAILVPVDQDDLTGATSDQLLDALPVALARVSAGGELLYLNDAARKLLGSGTECGCNFNDLLEGLGRSMDERIKDMMQGREHMRTEVARAMVNGHEVFLQVTLDRVLLDGESSVLAFLNDATELKTLEAQFVQSQKMQAVGQLAGGVAHDFNNLLTAINGHCDLILMRHETTDTDYGDLIQIRHNANRAASLVGQLLAFSRKQTLRPKVIDLYDTLSDLNHLLNRLLGEKVSLRIENAEDLPSVRVDERQLEQVIMNLVVNARDAMPNGGEVVIQTNEAVFEEDTKMDRVVVPFGAYVKIDVTDTGVGIPPEKIAKIFEPFFTTKGVGEGTGLGLSTAYGIIKQTGGFIFVYSEVGAGTTFTLYLPTHTDQFETETDPDNDKPEATDLTGRGVVLLVEDEVPVRSFAARALKIRGYDVVEAGSAEEALEILENEDLQVDVFVSDVIMPGMDGPTWVRMAQKDRPNVKVVFVSGYAEDVFEDGQISVPNATFLPKPFSLNELTHTVKIQLESEPT